MVKVSILGRAWCAQMRTRRPRSRFRARPRTPIRDLIADVIVEVSTKRAKCVMMMLAVALSAGSLLSAVGISTTAARQVDADLAASTIDLFTVSGSGRMRVSDVAAGSSDLFPSDAELRLEGIGGVIAAGRAIDVSSSLSGQVRRTFDDRSRSIDNVSVYGVMPGYIQANGADYSAGSDFMLGTNEHVVVLGAAVADELDVPVTSDPTGIVVDIDGREYSISGFITGGSTDLSRSILIPYALGRDFAGSDAEAILLVRTEVGAGASVANVARLALRADAPEILKSSTVIDAGEARSGVATQLDRLAAGVGALFLVLSVLLIANSMVVSVMSRTGEIGLRRAIGSSSAYVAMLFLFEGLLAGLLGGLGGSALAACTLSAIAFFNEWTVVMSPWLLAVGPVLGAVTGLVSSAYPAARASRVAPAQAVRAD